MEFDDGWSDRRRAAPSIPGVGTALAAICSRPQQELPTSSNILAPADYTGDARADRPAPAGSCGDPPTAPVLRIEPSTLQPTKSPKPAFDPHTRRCAPHHHST
jgi:hypothetical protein